MTTFLKTIITVFLLVAISFAFANASHAMSVDQHLITGNNPMGYSGCATPPTKTTFSPTDPRVYSWLFLSNAFLTDIITWKWYAPDNSLYVSYPYAPGVIGSACTWGYIDISGQPAASKTGIWKVEIYNGSSLAATDTFTISKPLCAYIYSAWGPCQPNGTQERTITSSSPAGCIEWVPQLTQTCTYVPPALSAPKNLRYTFSNNILTIKWDSVAGAAGYKLGLGVQSGKYDNVNDLGNIVQLGPADVRTTAPGTYSFYLAVKAYAGSQESSYSNEIVLNITVAGPSIEAPKNLRYSSTGNMMTIIWDAVSGAKGYKVGLGTQSATYLGPYDLGKATQIGPFDATTVASGTYYLAAKAYKDGYESAYSNEIAINLMPPSYTFSDDQKNLIVKFGNPQYLIIVFNSDPERREETWTYAALGKMYLFWDGVQVGEQSITVDPILYAKPPSIDPSLFAKQTKPYDVIKTLGNDYTITNASSLDPEFATLDFNTYYFKDKGVLASFIGETLAVVQTNDIPSKNAAGIGKMGQNLAVCENSDAFVRLAKKPQPVATQTLALAIAIGLKSVWGYDISKNILWDECFSDKETSSEACMLMIKRTINYWGSEATITFATIGYWTIDLIDLADTNCNTKPSALDSNELSLSGNGAVITCPNQCSFTYSDWSACQPNGTHTRTVTSKSPAGCKGDPAPGLLTQSCPYTPPCTSYTYTDSVCVPNYWDRRLGTITRTYKGIPNGCSGNVPPPEDICCDGLDPC